MLIQTPSFCLSVYCEDTLHTLLLPDRMQGQFLLRTGDLQCDAEILEIAANKNEWHVVINEAFHFEHSRPKELVLFDGMVLTFLNSQKEKYIVLCTQQVEANYRLSYFQIEEGIKYHIGRSKKSHIVLFHPFVSNEHALLYMEDDTLYIEDRKSTNGVYVNNKRISKCEVYVGDMLHIMGVQLIIGQHFIGIPSNFNHLLKVNRMKHFKPKVIEEKHAPSPFLKAVQSPYAKRSYQHQTIVFEDPPPAIYLDDTPFLLLLGPSLTMGISSLFMGAFSFLSAMSSKGELSQVLPTLVMSISMAFGTLIWPITAKLYEKHKKQKQITMRKQMYIAYLNERKHGVLQAIEEETKYCLQTFETTHVAKDMLSLNPQYLWNRIRGSEHYLSVVYGVGNKKASLEVTFTPLHYSNQKDDLFMSLHQFLAKERVLEQVPLQFDLKKQRFIGTFGKWKDCQEFLLDKLLQVAITHSYREVKLIVIMKWEDAHHSLIAYLPHVFDFQEQHRYLICNEMDAKHVNRLIEKQYDEPTAAGTHDAIIFSFDRRLEKRFTFLQRVLSRDTYCGISYFQICEHEHELHKECSSILNIKESEACIKSQNGKYTSFRYERTSISECHETLKILMPYYLNETNGYEEEQSLHFLDMFQCGNLEQLNIYEKWQHHDIVHSLEVPIGMDAHGECITLDAHEDYHGPHGLVAGMTGSGKSEFIITYILSLALHFKPTEVSFVIIDYKGGTTAKLFHRLPHIAGILTNLDDALIQRALIAIRSELTRRQRQFSYTSKKLGIHSVDIYKYQKLMKEGVVDEPLSHLFIIADEFAELKSQQSEFMEDLKQIARIGRSLGVHLILATQKPNGVVDDQIWSNARFHICLKVQEKADSFDMLKREEAAFLQKRGQFYLQVGYDELFLRGIAAWSQAPYIEMDHYRKEEEKRVTMINTTGTVIEEAKVSTHSMMHSATQLDSIVEAIAQLSKVLHIHAKAIWEEPLPKRLLLRELTKKYEEEMLLGELDDPFQQVKRAFTCTLDRLQNIVLIGKGGSGKHRFLTTFLCQLIMHYHVGQVKIYLIDFQDQRFEVFRNAILVRDVLYAQQQDEIRTFFHMLQNEVKKRKKDHKLCAYKMIIILHDFEVFHEMYQELEEELLMLLREGNSCGIHFLFTATTSNGIPYRFLMYMEKVILMQLKEKSDYHSVFADTNHVYPMRQKGSAILKEDKVYVIQIAEVEDDLKEEIINAHCGCVFEDCIPRLPSSCLYDENMDNDDVILGIDVQNKEYRKLTKENTICLILGAYRLSQTFLQALLCQLALREQVYVVTIQKIDWHGMLIQTNFDEGLRMIMELDNATILWYKFAEIYQQMKDQTIIGELLQKEHFHFIFIDTMDGVNVYHMQHWFSYILSEASKVWLGKGIMDYGYSLKISHQGLQNQLPHNHGYLWEAGNCCELLLMEKF